MAQGTCSKSDEWTDSVYVFRSDPYLFLRENNLTEEGFLLDMLQALWKEDLSFLCKKDILGCVIEHFDILINTQDNILQFYGTLKELSGTVKSLSFRSHLFISLTSLVSCSCNNDRETGEDLVNFFIEIIKESNDMESCYSRMTACTCLQELLKCDFFAPFVPALLNRVYALCQVEISPVQQYYLALYAALLADAVELHEESISIAVTQREDPVRKSVSIVMNSVDKMTVPCLLNTLLDIARVVGKRKDLADSVFSSIYLKYLPSSNISMFHLLIVLRKKGADSFSETDNLKLSFSRICLLASNPSFTTDYKLLCMKFLSQMCDDDSKLSENLEGSMLPFSYDDIETYAFKLGLQLRISDNSAAVFKQIFKLSRFLNSYQFFGKMPSAFFWILRACHEKYKNFMHSAFQQILLGIAATGQYSARILDYVQSLKNATEMEDFIIEFLSDFVETRPPATNLVPWLQILMIAVTHKDVSVELIAKQLKMCCELSDHWEVHHKILSVCSSIMAHRDTRDILTDLADIIEILLEKGKRKDQSDISDRAHILLLLLLSTSSEKCRQILVESDERFLTSFVTGNVDFVNLADVEVDCITAMDLTYFFHQRILSTGYMPDWIKDVHEERDVSVLLCQYRSVIKSCEIPPLRMQCTVNLATGSEEVFAVHYQLTSSSAEYTRDVFRTNLKNNDQFNVLFQPEDSVPCSIQVQTLYTTKAGENRLSILDPIEVRLEYHFMKLPLIEGSNELEIFNILWDDIVLGIGRGNPAFAKSVYCGRIDSIQESSKKLAPFVIREAPTKVGIFLPPNFHLLLLFRTRAEGASTACIDIVTDNASFLEHVNDFLLGSG